MPWTMMMTTASPVFAPGPWVRRWRDQLILLGFVLAMLAGMAGLAAATGWEDTLTQLKRLSLLQILILLGLSMVNYLCRGLRWHMFARRLGLRTGLFQNLRHFMGGFAMSVTPGRLGELVRMRWLRRETGWPFERTAPLVLVDRAADLAAMGVILALSTGLSKMGAPLALPVAIAALGVALMVTRPTLLSWGVTRAYRTIGRFARIFGRIRTAARSLSRFSTPGTLIGAGILGCLGWVAEGYSLHLLLVWLGADIGLWSAILIFVFATLAGGLTGAPGGLGGAEAAMVALLVLEGVPLEISLPATAVIRLTTLWFAIGLGVAVFPIAERLSKRAAHALEN